MSPSELDRLTELFDAACEITDAPARTAFLDEQCAGSPDLRARIDRLIAADATARDGFLKNPVLGEHRIDDILSGISGPMAVPVLAVGAEVGRYAIVERLGQGGMGIVYAAHDKSLDRRVALKLLNERPDETSRARLLREARSLARVVHPNVVAIHEVGETEDGHLFLAMELVEGPTLRTWSRGRPWVETITVYLEAGRGLAAVHAAGLVHRDFKADNVLIDGHGRPRVADFGLAALAPERRDHAAYGLLSAASEQEEHEHEHERRPPSERAHSAAPLEDVLQSPLTRTGTLIGTPRYMAPEVIRGEGATRLSDQYSFSVALFETLYARHPSEMPDRGVQNERGAPPPAVLSVLRRGLAPAPGSRHGSMEDLLDELAAASDLTYSDSPRLRRQRLRVLVSVLVAAMVLSTWVLGKGPTNVISSPRDAFLFSFIPTTVVAIAILMGRRTLMASRQNRQFVTVLALLCGALLAHRALELRFLSFEGNENVRALARILCGDMLIFSTMLAVAAVFTGRRVATLAAIALAASIGASIFPSLAPNVMACMMLAIPAFGVFYWRAALRN